MKTFNIHNVINLSALLILIGITDSEEADAFIENINTVTWGDASYTLINVNTFWTAFLKDTDNERMKQAWADSIVFKSFMHSKGIEYINLEG